MTRIALLCVLALSGCVADTEVTRAEEYSEDLPAAVGAPAAFVVDESRSDPGSREIGDCPPFLTDRNDGVRLRLSTSRRVSRRDGDTTFVRGYGDYFVEPDGSYGIGAGELLRVDCARYAPVGRTSG